MINAKTIRRELRVRSKKITIRPMPDIMSITSHWDYGHRDYWYILSENGEVLHAVPQNGTPFGHFSLGEILKYSLATLEAGEYNQLYLERENLADNAYLIKVSNMGSKTRCTVYSKTACDNLSDFGLTPSMY